MIVSGTVTPSAPECSVSPPQPVWRRPELRRRFRGSLRHQAQSCRRRERSRKNLIFLDDIKRADCAYAAGSITALIEPLDRGSRQSGP